MFGTHDLWLFGATVFVLNATPGVDRMLTLARTLQHGVRGGARWHRRLHAPAAGFGLAALLATSAAAFATLKWGGAVYLFWLALGMLRAGLKLPAAAAPAPAPSAPGAWRLFRQGLYTNALNPQVALAAKLALAQRH